MALPRLTQIELDNFKSFHSAYLPIDDVVVLTGRNGGGKSNALDALDALTRLATGEDVVDALDGRRREGGPIRGGLLGCVPHGDDAFAIGCAIGDDAGEWVWRIEVEVTPRVRIRSESLWGPAPAVESGVVEDRWLYQTCPAEPDSVGLTTEIHNGRRGRNPRHQLRDSRALLAQVQAFVHDEEPAGRAVLAGVLAVSECLGGVFHLDPVPQLMRGYALGRDVELRRSGENLSAALRQLQQSDPAGFERVVRLVAAVAGQAITGIDFVTSSLGDVMFGLVEGPADRSHFTPAREMSDGMLRFTAIATALLTARRGLDVDHSPASVPVVDAPGPICIVIEELENGLHPSQAERVLELIRTAAQDEGTQVVVTTHSPALLDAAEGELNEHVYVAFRGDDGRSRIERLSRLSGYEQAMARGTLGQAVTKDELTRPAPAPDDSDFSEFRRLLGID